MDSIDLRTFEFSIIYSVDVDTGVSLDTLTPPEYRKNGWRCTERVKDDDCPGRHRKYCAILNYEQFVRFLEYCNLVAERCRTMGSLGAPGFGFGWSPAVSFQNYYDNISQCAYVTPIPPDEPINPDPLLLGMPDDVTNTKPNWDEVELEMWDWFEAGEFSADAHIAQLA